MADLILPIYTCFHIYGRTLYNLTLYTYNKNNTIVCLSSHTSVNCKQLIHISRKNKKSITLHFEGEKEWNGMEWKNKNILRIFFHFPCLEV